MNKVLKRIISAVTATALLGAAVVFDVPGKLIAAAADHTNHPACGDASCTDASHSVSDWIAISDANGFSSLTNGGHYYLTGSVTLTDEVTITNNITLCLNGQTISAASGKRIFTVSGNLTLCDCKGNGKLTGGNDSKDGGGAIWVKGGTFNMYGGTISGNTTTRDMYGGGGVFISSSGTFNMYGGTISDNKAYTYGNGVHVSGGIFTMYGGTIKDNEPYNTEDVSGGGVSIGTSGTFIMNGGTISGNTAGKNGGGVYDYGLFTMNGGTISGNKITQNTQYGDFAGGGVYVYGASNKPFIMNGGTISNNTSVRAGGGVYSSQKPFIMNGGTISGNTAGTNGGGMYNGANVTLNGNVTITGNKSGTVDAQKDDNVYLPTNKTLTIGSDFSTTSQIGITTQTAPVSGTPVNITTTDNVSANLVSSFKADLEGQEIVYNTSAGTLQLAVPIPHIHGICGVSGCTDANHPAGHDTEITDWQPISDEAGLAAMVDGGHYYLTDNINITNVITIKDNTEVTLCLNGKTITQTGNGKNIFKIGTVDNGSAELTAILNICDCSADNAGTLTGGKGAYGGGVEIRGTLNMYGGTISGNQSTGSGGGVYIRYGTFNMYDGAITNNTTTSAGGGVNVSVGNNKFYMYGGTISGNTANTNGGGVYVGSVGSTNFTMYGGTIKNNTATNSGGGIYAARTELAGNVTVKDNKSGAEGAQTDSNICVQNNALLTIGADFSTDSPIGISTVAVPICKTPVVITNNNVNKALVDSFKAETNGQEIAFDNIWKRLRLTVPHNYEGSEWIITKAPTTTAAGTATRTCTTAGCTQKETKELPKIAFTEGGVGTDGTDWTVEYTAPTLTGDGSYVYTNTDGLEIIVTIPALNDTATEGGTDKVWTKVEVGTGADQSKNPTPTAGGTFVYTSTDYGTIEVEVPALNDSGTWKKTETTKPSIDAGGKYTYTSDDFGTVEVEVPALNDEKWTKTETTKPSISAGGEYTYTNDYGTVTVEVPKLTDTDFWTKKTTGNTEPKENTPGSYTYTSDYGETTVEVPELSDETVWTKTTTPATEEADGKDVYTSAYGTVEITIPSLNHEHTLTHVDGTPATETTTGTKEHWHCDGCNKDFADEDGTTEITDLTIPVIGHTHTLTHVPEVPATDTTAGTKEHWHCDGCNKDYADANGTTEITDRNYLTIPVIGHTHTLTHVPEVSATETETGTKEHWHCDGCGKDFTDENGENEATADTLKIGKIHKDVQCGANAPATVLATPYEALVDAILSSEEQAAVNEGKDIQIILYVKDATGSVSAEDKEKIDTAIGGLKNYKLGQYLEVELLKKIGGSDGEKITRTNKPIRVTFDIPADMLGKGEYSVIRIHDGEVTVLPDLDTAPNTVTIETDRFSTYVLTYREKAASSKPSGGGSHYSRPSTGDTSSDTSSDTSDSTSDDTSGNTSSDTSNDTSDNTSSGDTLSETSEDISTDTSDDTSSETSDGTSSDISGDTSDDTSDETSDDTSDITSDIASGESSDSGESDHISSENSTSEDSGNPATGIAISLIPLAVTLSGVIVLVNRRKK